MKRLFLVLFLGSAFLFANAQLKTPVKVSELKKEITDYIAKNYDKEFSIVSVLKINSKGIITFEVTIQKDTRKVILTFDAIGKFLKKIEPKNEKNKVIEGSKKDGGKAKPDKPGTK